MRLKLISCEVFYREMCAAAARSRHQVDIEFLPRGPLDCGCREMLARLQAAVDAVDPTRYNAVVLGYGLCGNAVAGLTARAVPVVLPRAQDCITLFMGGKERFLQYVTTHPAVQFKTTGWIERVAEPENDVGLTFPQLVARYGEENAQFLQDQLHNYTLKYKQFTFIEMGVEPDDSFERSTLEEAERRGWRFEKVRGDMSLLQALVDGDWDPDKFLVITPGHRVVASDDEGIVDAV